MSQRGRLWLLAAPVTVNLLRPLERVNSGGDSEVWFRPASGLWSGSNGAINVVMGEQVDWM